MADLSHATWYKSSYSGGNGGDCVEVASGLPGLVAVRDSKNPEGGTLSFPPGIWQAFLADIKAGRLS